MKITPSRMSGALFVLAVFVGEAFAGGLLADRANTVLIEGQFSDPEQGFLLLFSASPLKDERGKSVASLTEKELKTFANSNEQVLVKVYGKRPTKPGVFEFHFGTGGDQTQPWNDGREFDWENWAKVSADIWDNLCVVAPLPPSARTAFAAITSVAIIKGDKLLYDSRKRESMPNKQPITAGFPKFNAAPKGTAFPVLNLAESMTKFRRQYYEIGDNPFLNIAYADLGQTEKRKYANRGNNWCSEFATWVYRENGLQTPDPNRSDVHFRNMSESFARQGKVYPMREVVTWSDKEKIARIKPGSFVSILIGDSTHSLIFTTWVRTPQGPVTSYTAISGNNRGMVWPHSPLKLPTADSWKGKSAAELAEFDARVYFAVPNDTK